MGTCAEVRLGQGDRGTNARSSRREKAPRRGNSLCHPRVQNPPEASCPQD